MRSLLSKFAIWLSSCRSGAEARRTSQGWVWTAFIALWIGLSAHAEIPFVLGVTDWEAAEAWFSVRSWNAGELGLHDHRIRALAHSPNGYLWIGTDSGLHRFDGISTREVLPERRPEASNLLVTCLASTTDGALWIGSETAGILRYANGRFEHPTLLLTNDRMATNVLQIIVNSQGKAAVCSTEAVFLEDGRVFRQTVMEPPLPTPLTGIAFDTEDRLWVSTKAGLYRRDGRAAVLLGSTNQSIDGLTAAPDKAVWYHATDGGLMRLGEFGPILRADLGPPPSKALSQSNGLLWLAGSGWTLHCITSSNKLAFIKPPFDGKQNVTALTADADGGVWAALGQGLVRVSRHQAPAFNGRLPVYIETLLVDGVVTELPVGGPPEPVVLPPGAKSLEIRFTAIHFRDPRAVRVRYQLEGLEPGWVEASSRKSAYYTHLPAGNYRFKIQASLPTGSGMSEDELSIRVEPQWWERRSVIAAALIGAVSLAAALHGARIHRLTQQKRDQVVFSRRLLESQESERKRISRELHDSLAQSLLVIKNRAFFAIQNQADPAMLKSHLTEIYEASGEAVGEVREISHALHPPQLERVGLSRTIESIARQVAKAGNLQLTTSIDPVDELFDASESINLLRIVQESLSNTLKHSNASSIKLSALRKPSEVMIEIQDDGRGFDSAKLDPSDPEVGLGLLTLRERARTLGGELQIISKPQEGVTILLRVPIRVGTRHTAEG